MKETSKLGCLSGRVALLKGLTKTGKSYVPVHDEEDWGPHILIETLQLLPGRFSGRIASKTEFHTEISKYSQASIRATLTSHQSRKTLLG